jgi:hypothetical protein
MQLFGGLTTLVLFSHFDHFLVKRWCHKAPGLFLPRFSSILGKSNVSRAKPVGESQ